MKARLAGVAALLMGMTFAFAEAPPPEFRLHEWGTFTTVSGSDGVLLPGLDRDEEGLPQFVTGRKGMQAFINRADPKYPDSFFMNNHPEIMRMSGKGLFRAADNVTVKMETPVIYVYSDNKEAFRLDIDVGFKPGLITQYYPQPMSVEMGGKKGYEAYPGKDGLFRLPPIDFATPQNGRAQWMVNVQPKSPVDDFKMVKAGETTTWIRPRVRDANVLTDLSGQQAEGFVFYRGLGNFDIPLKTTMDGDTLTLHSKRDLAYALVYQTDGWRSKILWDGPLTADKDQAVDTIPGGYEHWRGVTMLDSIKVDLLTRMQKAMVNDGLTPGESSAMLRTWWDSYFCHAGLRVFWMVPRNMTDELLPIKLSAEPKSMQRVLVGRAEVLSPGFEGGLAKSLKQEGNHLVSDRYYAAYRARVKAMHPDVVLPDDPYDRRFELKRVMRNKPKPPSEEASKSSPEPSKPAG